MLFKNAIQTNEIATCLQLQQKQISILQLKTSSIYSQNDVYKRLFTEQIEQIVDFIKENKGKKDQ